MVLDGSINGEWCEAYVGHVLVPELNPIEKALPGSRPCSAKLASGLPGLWHLIGKLVDLMPPTFPDPLGRRRGSPRGSPST